MDEIISQKLIDEFGETHDRKVLLLTEGLGVAQTYHEDRKRRELYFYPSNKKDFKTMKSLLALFLLS